MIMKEGYKQKRQELVDLLIEFDVPKTLWYSMSELNYWLYVNKNWFVLEGLMKMVDLVRELSPTPLTMFDFSPSNIFLEVDTY